MELQLHLPHKPGRSSGDARTAAIQLAPAGSGRKIAVISFPPTVAATPC
jgi:hypothetical protein